ncbi:hypothetical protein BIV57_01470 [Mangrovactinospora gilvigrisea]|uniref:HTH tetR-type domain-containing protein n=2 Tax=Mangrovactinospora gilvigrisea TaxID=1428644 RepID=A0A1J7CCC5_9ACTN|nr:hypothetical protein BIV57_01470 [Mangrovactinospora gilvigrisea]
MVRKSADERRAEVVRAAVTAFARGGYAGTSTAQIADAVGVSQPYLFRLYKNKKQLFLAAELHCHTRVRDVLAQAAEGRTGEAAVKAMGLAYVELLQSDSALLRFLIQAYAACDDEEIRTAVTDNWTRMWQFVAAMAGAASLEEVRPMIQQGLAITVIAAMNPPEGHPLWLCVDEIRTRLNALEGN